MRFARNGCNVTDLRRFEITDEISATEASLPAKHLIFQNVFNYPG